MNARWLIAGLLTLAACNKAEPGAVPPSLPAHGMTRVDEVTVTPQKSDHFIPDWASWARFDWLVNDTENHEVDIVNFTGGATTQYAKSDVENLLTCAASRFAYQQGYDAVILQDATITEYDNGQYQGELNARFLKQAPEGAMTWKQAAAKCTDLPQESLIPKEQMNAE